MIDDEYVGLVSPNSDYHHVVTDSDEMLCLELSASTRPCIIKKMGKSLSNGQPIFAFSDMSLSPVSINDVIQKIDSLVRQKAKGIFQLSGVKDISYFDFAKEFAKENGFSEKLVREDFWKDKIQFAPPNFTSLVNI